jgi:hypothetical protein
MKKIINKKEHSFGMCLGFSVKRVLIAGIIAGIVAFVVGNILYLNPWFADIYVANPWVGASDMMQFCMLTRKKDCQLKVFGRRAYALG